jgi:hypothetical protein
VPFAEELLRCLRAQTRTAALERARSNIARRQAGRRVLR